MEPSHIAGTSSQTSAQSRSVRTRLVSRSVLRPQKARRTRGPRAAVALLRSRLCSRRRRLPSPEQVVALADQTSTPSPPPDRPAEEDATESVSEEVEEAVVTEAGRANGEMAEEEEEEEQEEEEEEVEDNDPVFDLRCAACGTTVCRRGMCVQLVADSSARLYSTDFRPRGVTEAKQEREHNLCRCMVRDVACSCGHLLGYHVIRPCSSCESADHNDHYWLMSRDQVVPERRLGRDGQPVHWLSASTTSVDLLQMCGDEEMGGCSNLGTSENRQADGTETEVPPELCCPICHELMVEPMAPPCQHAACLVCLTRAVDLRRECPCCRRPTTSSELVPVPESLLAV